MQNIYFTQMSMGFDIQIWQISLNYIKFSNKKGRYTPKKINQRKLINKYQYHGKLWYCDSEYVIFFTMPKKPEPAKEPSKAPEPKGKPKQESPKPQKRKDILLKNKEVKQTMEKDNKHNKSIEKLGKSVDKKGGKQPADKEKGNQKKEIGKKDVKDAGKKVDKSLEKSKSTQKIDVKGKKQDPKNQKDEKNKKGDPKDDRKDRGRSQEKEGKDKNKDQKGKNQLIDPKKAGKNDPKQSPKANQKGKVVEPPKKPKEEQDIIKESGLLEAYQLFLRAVCKHGLPEGNVYEFAAQQIQKYERKKRAQELKAKAEQEIQRAARRREERMNLIDND